MQMFIVNACRGHNNTPMLEARRNEFEVSASADVMSDAVESDLDRVEMEMDSEAAKKAAPHGADTLVLTSMSRTSVVCLCLHLPWCRSRVLFLSCAFQHGMHCP